MAPTPVAPTSTTLLGYFLKLGVRPLIVIVTLGLLAGAGSSVQVALTAQLVSSDSTSMLFFGGVWAGTFVALVAIDVVTSRIVADGSMRIRLDIVRRLIEADLRSTEKAGTGQLLGVLTEDVAALATAMTAIPMIGTSTLVIVGGLGYLAALSPTLALVHFGTMVCAVGLTTFPFVRAMAASRAAARVRQGLIERFRYIVSGGKELKLDQARRRWNVFHAAPVEAQMLRDHSVRQASHFAVVRGLSRVFAFVVVGVTAFVGRRYLDASAQELATFAITSFFLLGPVEAIIGWMPSIAAAQMALARLEKVGLDLGAAATRERQANGYRTAFQTIDLEDVTFAYEGGFHVGPFDLTIGRGQIVFIVGGNGSGKSTFAKLLCGLYRPKGGHLSVDDEEVDDFNRDSYRQLFAAVFVDFCLFPEITSVDEQLDEASARELLELLDLSSKVTIVANRFSTTELSTGQRKRLALVAACLRNPEIFVFDEWAADQDPAFRKVFYRKILPELRARGKTVVAITHDEAYFDAADVVVKLEEGRIVSEPTRMFMARLTGNR